MKLCNFAAIAFSSCRGVVPPACTSPASGNEIFPSERTGTSRETSGSFQTLMASTSSAPITKVSSWGLTCATGPGSLELFGVAAAALLLWLAASPDCAHSQGESTAHVNRMTNGVRQLFAL